MTYVFPLPFIWFEMTCISPFRFIWFEMAYVFLVRFIPVEMTCFGAGLDGAGAVIKT